jgi:hypothetical protein
MDLASFREKTKDMPGSTMLVSPTSNSMEMSDSIEDAHISIKKMSKKVEHFRDAFDGGHYSSEVWSDDGKGEDVIYVRG